MIQPNDSLSGSVPESDPQTSLPSPSPEIITDLTGLTPEEQIAGIERLFDQKAEELFMVFSLDKTKHFRQPHSPDYPWVTKLRKQADYVAKAMGGIAVTVAEGMKIMFAQILAQNKQKRSK